MVRKLTIVLVLVAAFGAQMVSIHAQSANLTPQPEQAFIQDWGQEIIYPAAIRFTLTVALPPDQIKSVTLNIQPDTLPVITIPLDFGKTASLEGSNTGFAYVWQIPADNPPLLFKDVTFSWQVTSQSGQNGKIQDKITFEDPRANWLHDLEITSSLKLTFPNGKAPSGTVTPAYSGTGIDDLTSTLKQIIDLLSHNLGNIPTFNLLIEDTTLLPLCTQNSKGESVAIGISNIEVNCQPNVADSIYAASGYSVLKLSKSSLGDIQNAVSNYIVQQAYEPRWTGKDIPEWFQAGLIEFYAPSSKAELNAPVLLASRSNSLLSLDAMAKTPSTNMNADLWHSESYGLVVYIASQIGVDGLFKLANDVSTASSFAEAYQTATGKSLDTLISSFGRWLFTDAASGAFTFTAYQAATPSPTPSRTPTATRTPSPTATETFTLTPTVTGVLSRTPMPSHTPTLTPTEASATTTPRPAGSLNTPTPTPNRSSATTNTNLSIGIIVLAIGGIIVLIAAYILFRPRR